MWKFCKISLKLTSVIQFVTLAVMRNIINISVPSSMRVEIEEAVKNGQYASKSEFFRDLVRSWKEMKLLGELRQSQKEIKQGKGKTLRSLKSLR